MRTGTRSWSGVRGGVAWPAQIAIGIALVAVAWPLAWAGPAPWSEHTFFPLWLGYILTVDGITERRGGTSLVRRSPVGFALLFAYSIPLWWLFEFANGFLGNWEYRSPRSYDPLVYTALASLAFSTVLPALCVTAEFWRTTPALRRPARWVRFAPSRRGLGLIAAAGLGMFVLSLMAPRQAFPLVWIGLFLFLDPINALTGGRSLAAQVARGRWDTVWVLFASGLTCGFFWEMWNIRSMPKWVYDVPYLAGPKLFEMPWLGYGGYLPFALEVYAAYHLLQTLLRRGPDRLLTFDAIDDAAQRRVDPRFPSPL